MPLQYRSATQYRNATSYWGGTLVEGAASLQGVASLDATAVVRKFGVGAFTAVATLSARARSIRTIPARSAPSIGCDVTLTLNNLDARSVPNIPLRAANGD